jgi:hypothetical protein
VPCIRREFTVWSSERSSPIVEWLGALARHAENECCGKGIGAIGLCLTGGFAFAMMTEPTVIAPVLGEPSLPVAITPIQRRAIDASHHPKRSLAPDGVLPLRTLAFFLVIGFAKVLTRCVAVARGLIKRAKTFA